jgi:glutathione synthase/RimK-type ligase-like ATP-grasp enzyme
VSSADAEVALLTDARLVAADDSTPWLRQLLLEERLVADAFAQRGWRARRVAWSDPEFDWHTVRVALFRSTWDYFERAGEFTAWLARAEAATRLIHDAAIVRWNMDKRYLLDLAAAGVRVVPTLRIERGGALDLEKELAAAPDGVVVKPAVSGAARATWRVDAGNRRELAGRITALLQAEAVLVQPFRTEILRSGEVSVVVIDGRCSHAVRKRAKPGDFRVQDDHGGTVATHAATRAETELAERALASVPGRALYARADLVATPDGPELMELELIEPELFFRFRPQSAGELVAACLRDIEA